MPLQAIPGEGATYQDLVFNILILSLFSGLPVLRYAEVESTSFFVQEVKKVLEDACSSITVILKFYKLEICLSPQSRISLDNVSFKIRFKLPKIIPYLGRLIRDK